MQDPRKTAAALRAESCVKHLRMHGFGADYFETKEEVLSYLKENIPKGSSIGIGGSVTLTEIGVLSWLTGNEEYHFLDRYHTDDVSRVFHESLNADVYLMSTNALTEEGELYNIDGNGNRLAALIYGPKKVYVIAGTNKIVKNLEEAVSRVELFSAPANNIRLGKTNPCTKTGQCMHCSTPSTICNQIVTTRRSGTPGRIHVLLVNEAFGY
ncbi:lactate utilization protein [Stecheria intestinalis]|uniref:lactate utilization protein n=1 Tax=Stecheria intestinalis TaxID=2606630 RepID=UPI0023F1B357|nr:lactate utilization protein [Stecheria intestinalis]MDD5881270.1 lactate utilization protein [Stecheria intestinalis]